MMTVEEIHTSADSARWNTYNVWAQMRAVRAQLMSDVANHASPEVVASDRAELAHSQQQFTHHRNASAHHVDVSA